MCRPMKLDKELLNSLFEQARNSPRLRQNLDLRTSSEDSSQRMLNALLAGTEVAVHKHPNFSENRVCLCGRMDVILCDSEGKETERLHVCPAEGNYGCVLPADTWHTVEVLEPSVIYEGKDGKYGENQSVSLENNSN